MAAPEPLTLKQAIERAMNSNPDILIESFDVRSAELTYQDAWDQMFLPGVSLHMSSYSTRTVGRLPESNHTDTTNTHGYPGTSVSMNLGQYTLFNFGRDLIVYNQAKLDWDRTRQAYEESKRAIRFEVIIAFWTLKSALDKLDAYQRAVNIAQAILDLQESRYSLGTANETDVSSSRVDLYNAKNYRDASQTEAKGALYALNVLLGDPAGRKYRIDEEISFLPIKVTEAVLYETYLKESPRIKNFKKALAKSELAVELTRKNLLPLPTIQFSGVTLAYSNGYLGSQPKYYSSALGYSNLDVSAVVSLTLPLVGPGGLFGHRIADQSIITRDQNEVKLRIAAKRDQQKILDLVQSIRQYEMTVVNNRENYLNNIQVLDSVFNRFMNSRTVSRLEIRDAITNARNSEIELSAAILAHLNYKTQLAAAIGVDYLPRME